LSLPFSSGKISAMAVALPVLVGARLISADLQRTRQHRHSISSGTPPPPPPPPNEPVLHLSIWSKIRDTSITQTGQLWPELRQVQQLAVNSLAAPPQGVSTTVAELPVTTHPQQACKQAGRAVRRPSACGLPYLMVMQSSSTTTADWFCSSAVAAFMHSAGSYLMQGAQSRVLCKGEAFEPNHSGAAHQASSHHLNPVLHTRRHPTSTLLAWAYLARRRSLFFELGASTMA
jgi:hypothetical protein